MYFNRNAVLAVCAGAATLLLTGCAETEAPEPASATASSNAELAPYQAVTAERLRNPEDGDWLMIRRTYDGWGYSPLDQINTANVANLKPLWGFPTGQVHVHEAAPIVNGGYMYVSTPESQVIALNAVTGETIWRYNRRRADGSRVPHETNRGVALYGDKVYVASGEAVLVALDAATGKVVWEKQVADNSAGYYTTLAPLIANDKIMLGASGGEFGIRGFVAAYDPETGEELWRTYTVPAPGEPGSETWPDGNQWEHGGGPVWVTGNYDPETNIAYWGTGNGGPWIGDQRPGDNLYIASTIALDADNGKIVGYQQYNPNESWDWDEVSPPILVDYEHNGEMIRGLIDVGRDGYVWFLERTKDGPINFVEGKPFVYQNVYESLDPKTGKPNVNPDHKPGTGRQAEFCPGLHGGKNWPPIAFNPMTRMIYIPANDNICGASAGQPAENIIYKPGSGYTFTEGFRTFVNPEGDGHFGEVQAWNVDTQELVWKHEYESVNWGSMLTTGGGLVFTGGTPDRKIHAFDAATGEILWEAPTPSGILAPPTTFTVNGKQYLAVLSGWGGDSAGMHGVLMRAYPDKFKPVPEGGTIWVYALP